MRTLVIIWIAIACLLGLFWLWHTPSGEPLTSDEIANYQSKITPSPGAIWADQEGFLNFLKSDDGKPFYMLNLLDFRDAPVYPDGFSGAEPTVDAANIAYGRAVVRLQLLRGSYPAFIFSPKGLLLNSYGPEIADFDQVVLARYRSRRDLVEMISSDAFQTAQVHKWAALERTLVVPVHSIAIIRPASIVLALLLLVGTIASLTVLYRRRRRVSFPYPPD